jgi:hypothetical protein
MQTQKASCLGGLLRLISRHLLVAGGGSGRARTNQEITMSV